MFFDRGKCDDGRSHLFQSMATRSVAPTAEQILALKEVEIEGNTSDLDDVIEALRTFEYVVVCVKCGKVVS